MKNSSDAEIKSACSTSRSIKEVVISLGASLSPSSRSHFDYNVCIHPECVVRHVLEI